MFIINYQRKFIFLFVILLGLGLQSCFKDECTSTRTFVEYTPVYKTTDEIRRAISVEGPRELKNTGKLFFSGNYIYINELRQGIHIVDNSNPANPTPVAFVDIPGNVDMAARANRLYVDNYIDLLTLDVTDPRNPRMIGRTEDVFDNFTLNQDLGYIVDYIITENKVEIDCQDPNYSSNVFFNSRNQLFALDNASINIAASVTPQSNVSTASLGSLNVGGSLARFTTVEEFLYTVDERDLRVFSLSNIDQPSLINTVNVGWQIETIFPHGDNLFIGAADGMYIFDNQNKTAPVQLSKFEHSRACDPVFVDGDIAYVTLRDGNTCEGFSNQLDVVDITDLSNPSLIATHQMLNPHGLSLLNNTVYICEGEHGFRSFDRSEHETIGDNLLDHVENFDAYDVIALPNNVALVIGKDGLYQFDISDPADIKEISLLPVNRD